MSLPKRPKILFFFVYCIQKKRVTPEEKCLMKKEKNNITEMVFILDRSGSMSGLESDTIGGFNGMLEKQKKEEGKAFVTTVLFDHETLTLHDRLPIEEVPAMTGKDYQVRGCTALLDAIGTTINHIKDVHHYIREEDVPDHTVFVITTDGMENASHEFTKKKVKELIKSCEEKEWEFLFLGANMDAVGAANDIGIREDRAVTYHCDAKGTALNYCVVSEALADIRAEKKLGRGWKKKIEEYEKEN